MEGYCKSNQRRFNRQRACDEKTARKIEREPQTFNNNFLALPSGML
jgi:hypothetical protein